MIRATSMNVGVSVQQTKIRIISADPPTLPSVTSTSDTQSTQGTVNPSADPSGCLLADWASSISDFRDKELMSIEQ